MEDLKTLTDTALGDRLNYLRSTREEMNDDISTIERELIRRMVESNAKKRANDAYKIELDVKIAYEASNDVYEEFYRECLHLSVPSDLRQTAIRQIHPSQTVTYATKYPSMAKIAKEYGGRLPEILANITPKPGEPRLKFGVKATK